MNLLISPGEYREGVVDLGLERMLSQADAELESAESELQAVQQRIEELRAIKRGVQLAMQRYGSDIGPSSSSRGAATQVSVNSDDSPWKNSAPVHVERSAAFWQGTDTPHGDLCIEVLRELGSASSLQVRDRLLQRGRPLEAEQVRNALQYMLRRGRVVRTEPGVWALPKHASQRATRP